MATHLAPSFLTCALHCSAFFSLIHPRRTVPSTMLRDVLLTCARVGVCMFSGMKWNDHLRALYLLTIYNSLVLFSFFFLSTFQIFSESFSSIFLTDLTSYSC